MSDQSVRIFDGIGRAKPIPSPMGAPGAGEVSFTGVRSLAVAFSRARRSEGVGLRAGRHHAHITPMKYAQAQRQAARDEAREAGAAKDASSPR